MRAYLALLRPPNLVTAMADILAGFAVSGATALDGPALPWLLLATLGLYGGGVVLNDVCDAKLDAAERPERPIPSGRVPRHRAALLGAACLAIGITAGAQVSAVSAGLAAAVACLAVAYDARSKHHPVLGPLTMGLCRGGNLLLGVSAVPAMVGQWWCLAALPVAYIAGLTAVSRGEVHGGRRGAGVLAGGAIGLVLAGILTLGTTPAFSLRPAAPFLLAFAAAVVPAYVRAVRTPAPAHIRAAVRIGVLSLILLDATLAAGFGGWMFGLITAALLPVAVLLARAFAVT